ncbi:DUF427 domain-containing protein [Smaragdicoccus niigatensis]|uniref:DUF427 domain-containing protein n=1 Tax=Smaragdicoccus niigatensis TaxID=359359 RepID=UPI000367DA2A|nr:DUF427 domain-containing protein [Smaragdicoccus niigatensis]
MADYPQALAPQGDFEPVPRRVRAVLAGRTVVDTQRARYVWESPKYPQFYIPINDIDAAALVDEHRELKLKRGTAKRYGLRVGDREVAEAVRVYQDGPLADHARFEWSALDAWYEEDERIFVHPRNPYARVDALRSTRHVEVRRNGVLLAESHSPVLLFETGLPTRYYLDPTDVRFEHLTSSPTQTQCPYKGVTSGYWSTEDVADIAWTYQFPLAACAAIAGLISFYNEKVDITVDGVELERPVTHFS